MTRFMCALFLFLSGFCGVAAAEPVRNGDYVVIKSDGGWWWLQPRYTDGGRKSTLLELRVFGGAAPSNNTNVFFVEKVNVTDGNELHSGNYVRLRGVNSRYAGGDPWLMAEGAGSTRVRVTTAKRPDLAEDPTVFFIDGLGVHNIEYGAPFVIRGTARGDNWFVAPAAGKGTHVDFTQTKPLATQFRFVKAERRLLDGDPPGPSDPDAPGNFAPDPHKDFLIIASHIDQVRQQASIFNVAEDCKNNATCVGVLKTISSSLGIPIDTVVIGAAMLSTRQDGEGTFMDIRLPDGYQYCSSAFHLISIVPRDGDRASTFYGAALDNGLHVETWTPVRPIGQGRSWVEGDLTVVGVRNEAAASAYASGRCYRPANRVVFTCRGAGCGDSTDDGSNKTPVR